MSKNFIIIGYQGNPSNCRTYDPATKKITVSRDVIFNKESAVETSSAKCFEDEFVLPRSKDTNNHEPALVDGDDDKYFLDDAKEKLQDS